MSEQPDRITASQLISGKRPLKKSPWYRRLFSKDQLLSQSMVIPGFFWYLLFCYVPMYGIILSFKNYSARKGIMGSPWVGLAHFKDLFADPDIPNILLNTVAIGFLKLLFCFPIAVIFALLLNEIRSNRFKRFVQTVSYFPYFISWIIVAMIVEFFLSPRNGVFNYFLLSLGLIDAPIAPLAQANAFWSIAVITQVWKETGWSAIIFLAAIAGIDPEIYEAAIIDGSSKVQRIFKITLPCISGTIILMFLLSFSGVFTGGPGTFDQSYFLGNPRNYDRSYVLSYYVLKTGLMQGRFSYATAVGFLNGIVSFTILLGSNMICKKATGRSLYMEGDY